jgi:hypothetical protein
MYLSVILALLPSLLTSSLPLSAPPPSDPNLYPSVANGHLGLTISLDAIYVSRVFSRDVEYLIGGCLQLSAGGAVSKILNPAERYELSGLCKRLDSFMIEHEIDPVEHNQGTRKARFSNPFAYNILVGRATLADSEVSFDPDSNVATITSITPTLRVSRSFYAHAEELPLLVHDLSISNTGATPITVSLSPDTSFSSLPEDLDLPAPTFPSPDVTCFVNATVVYPELPVSATFPTPPISICHTTLPPTITINPNETYERTFAYAVELAPSPTLPVSTLAPSASTAAALLSSHLSAWSARIAPTIVTGNSTTNAILASTMASLRSSLTPSSPPASPGGVPTNGYEGEREASAKNTGGRATRESASVCGGSRLAATKGHERSE